MGCMAQSADQEYARVQARLATGWNTWDTQSVTTHVLLPEALAIRVGIENQATVNANAFLATALIGRQGKDEERVVPGPHS